MAEMPEEVSNNPQSNSQRSGFVMIPRVVIRERRLSPVDFLVYVHVRDVAGESGVCWQSLDKIGRVLGKHRRTIQRAVRALVGYGDLEEEQREGRTTYLRVADIWAANAGAIRGGQDTGVRGTRDTAAWAGRTSTSTDREPRNETPSRTRTQSLSRAGARAEKIEEAIALALPLFAAIDPSACSQGIVRGKLADFLMASPLDPVTLMTEVLLPEFEWAARKKSVTRLDGNHRQRTEPIVRRAGYTLAVLDGTRVRDVAGVPPIKWKKVPDDGADIVDGTLVIDSTLLAQT
ncbi:MAG: helix-turn-helix domain-containing protein [Dehalococcoidia bacterium]|nr:helix-turn-helix domain-containing protein [Dehalococcoidia bacterium]